MIIAVKLDRDTLKKLDDTGTQLKIFTHDTRTLINSISDKAIELFDDLKGLLDALLLFLEEHNYSQSEIARLTLRIYKNYFESRREKITD